ncbi:MAG: COX15/CtaA family protein [Verrucomicrobia bacterium]|nr:COX15/CtaA family protein [Verrucomicrobiota bacterium]
MAQSQPSFRTSTHKPRLAVFATFGAVWVFVLLALGAFTTSIGAGMAFADWPLSNGSINPEGWLKDIAMFAEHSHRLSGSTMGLIAIGLAVWLHRTESRAWLRRLGWAGLIVVIVQGLIGGQRVQLDAMHLPGFQMSLGQMLRVPHGVLAQLYVCLLIAIAAGCSKSWIERAAPVSNALKKTALLCTGLVLVQLTIAVFMRHNAAGLAIPFFPYSTADHQLLPPNWDYRVTLQFAHRVMAVVLAIALPILVIMVRRDRAASLGMRFAASALFSLLVLQIFLGAQIVWTFRKPDVTTAHVIVGALVLATTFWLTWSAHRDAIEQPSAA